MESEPPAKKQKPLGGPGSSSGTVPSTTPKVKGDSENDGEGDVMEVNDDEEPEQW